MKKLLRSFSLVSLFIFCCSAIVFGQAITGNIEGVVKDQKGAVIPGVSVTLTGKSLGFTRTTQSGSDGSYRFQQVPAGSYKITTSASSGFSAATVDNVTVAVEKTTTTDIELGVSATVNTVEVSSDPLGVNIDATDSKVQTNITSKLIDTLPRGQSLTSLLRISPGTRSEPLSGGFQVDGASGSENSFTIDGQEVSNFRTGVLNATNNIPVSLIQEVQVKTSGFEAEHGGASGGVISTVTRSGSDTFHAEFGTQFESSKLQPNNRWAPSLFQNGGTAPQFTYGIQQPKDQYLNSYPSAQFSGPIWKKRVWGLVNASPQIFDTTRTSTFYCALSATATSTCPAVAFGSSTNGISGVTLNPNPAYAPLTYHGKTTYQYYYSKIDAAVLNNLRVSASYLFNPTLYDGLFPYSAVAIGSTPVNTTYAGTSLRSDNYAALQGGRTNSNLFNTQTTYNPTNNIVINFRYSHSFLNEKGTAAYAIANTTRYACSGLAAGYVGVNTNCTNGFANVSTNSLTSYDVSLKNEYNTDASYFVSNFGGRHDFKGGYQYGTTSNDVLSGYAATGQITFQYGRTSFASYYGVPLADCTGCVGIGRMIRFGAKGSASNKYQAIFIQDKWQPTSRLTLNLGVRMESENLPAFNTGGGNIGIPINFGWGSKVAPRLGGAYDLFGDGKTKIFASYGQFYDRMRFELPRGSFGGNFYRVDYFAISAANPNYDYYTPAKILGSFTDPIGGGNPSTKGGLSLFQQDFRIPSNLPASFYTSNGLDPAQVVPDLKAFRQSEISAGVERELTSQYVLSARYTRKNVDHAIEDHAIIGAYEGEAYYIGNPGEGTDLAADKAAGYVKTAKPQRLYNGLEIALNKRFSHNYYFNVNYTLSHLYGNYSGLASSDESGRTSPAVNRFFDYIINGFTATGNPDNGDLATDRRHTFKAYGGYTWDWWGSKTNSTEISFFQQVLQGTPQTTFISVGATSIPLSKRGDLGRTPAFWQTDLYLSHSYKFGGDGKYKITVDVTANNVFNNNSVTSFNTTKYTQGNAISYTAIDPCYDPDGIVKAGCTKANTLVTTALNAVLNGQINSQINAIGSASNPVNVLYGKANGYQSPRFIRFGFRFGF